jgi:hypothetical protein
MLQSSFSHFLSVKDTDKENNLTKLAYILENASLVKFFFAVSLIDNKCKKDIFNILGNMDIC